MPKRWERELQRLGDVPAPLEEIRSRSTHSSTGPEPNNGLPPTRQRVVAGIVAFGVFIAAAAFGWQAFRPAARFVGDTEPTAPRGSAVLSLDGSGDWAMMTLGFDGSSFEATPVGYDWCDESGANCESGTADYDVSDFLPIPSGTPIVIAGDASEVSGRFVIWRDACKTSCEFPMRSAVPTDPGHYDLLVDATFPRGHVQFSVGVQVSQPRVSGPFASMSFVGKNAPESTLTFGAESQSGIRSEYDWCEGDGGCVNGIADFATYPPVEAFIEIPAGTPLVLAEFVSVIKGTFRTQNGEKASPTFEDAEHLGTIPTDPGRYALELHVALNGLDDQHGSATFWFGVDATPTEGTQSVTPSVGNASDTLRVKCTAAGTEVLTPVVAVQADGVHVVVEAEAAEVPLSFRVLDPSIDSTSAGFGGPTRTFEPEPWPIAPGRLDVRCGSAAYAGNTSAPPVAFEVVDPAGHWVDPVLSCTETERTEVVGYDGGATEWFDEQAAIRGILVGVLPEDRVIEPLYGRDRLLRWVIVREGEIIGVVRFTWVTDTSDPRAAGLGRVDGDVCGDAGIDGTAPPRDPDQDGVGLDCKAGSQVAFRHEGTLVNLPLGEAFITANVPGIRTTDEVVSPVGVDGSDGWEGIWTIEREGKTVASINYPALDGITCRFNAIGTL